MKRLTSLLLAAALAPAGGAASSGPEAATAAAVRDTSYTTPAGRVQRHEAVVAAPLEAVWDAFTTTDGVTAWMVPSAVVDFRLGGTLETAYALDAEIPHPDNIKHEFLAYLPHRMIAMQVVNCPPGTPHPEVIEKLVWVTELEALDDERTLVRIAGGGYGDGEADDEIYRFFDSGNVWTLKQLQKRFAEGPADWPTVLATVPTAEPPADGP